MTIFQIPAFMQDIYQSLTEKDGVLKSLFTEEEMKLLLANPFHITRTNIRVRAGVTRMLVSRRWIK